MTVERRRFLSLAAGSAMAWALVPPAVNAARRSVIQAIAFDAFAIFDPRPIAALTETLFPGKGSAIVNVWRTRQFEYQWLHALAGRYSDFLQTTEESLLFTARQLQLDLSSTARQQLMLAWSNLKVWPDVSEGVSTLRKAGIRLTLLSNMTAPVLVDGLKQSGLESNFEAVLSTDQIQSYKPNPLAYRMAIDRLQLPLERILFVPFAGWDVAGAKWFGYPTFWLNRQGSPAEALSAEADESGADFNSLVQFVLHDAVGNRQAGAS